MDMPILDMGMILVKIKFSLNLTTTNRLQIVDFETEIFNVFDTLTITSMFLAERSESKPFGLRSVLLGERILGR